MIRFRSFLGRNKGKAVGENASFVGKTVEADEEAVLKANKTSNEIQTSLVSFSIPKIDDVDVDSSNHTPDRSTEKGSSTMLTPATAALSDSSVSTSPDFFSTLQDIHHDSSANEIVVNTPNSSIQQCYNSPHTNQKPTYTVPPPPLVRATKRDHEISKASSSQMSTKNGESHQKKDYNVCFPAYDDDGSTPKTSNKLKSHYSTPSTLVSVEGPSCLQDATQHEQAVETQQETCGTAKPKKKKFKNEQKSKKSKKSKKVKSTKELSDPKGEQKQPTEKTIITEEKDNDGKPAEKKRKKKKSQQAKSKKRHSKKLKFENVKRETHCKEAGQESPPEKVPIEDFQESKKSKKTRKRHSKKLNSEDATREPDANEAVNGSPPEKEPVEDFQESIKSKKRHSRKLNSEDFTREPDPNEVVHQSPPKEAPVEDVQESPPTKSHLSTECAIISIARAVKKERDKNISKETKKKKVNVTGTKSSKKPVVGKKKTDGKNKELCKHSKKTKSKRKLKTDSDKAVPKASKKMESETISDFEAKLQALLDPRLDIDKDKLTILNQRLEFLAMTKPKPPTEYIDLRTCLSDVTCSTLCSWEPSLWCPPMRRVGGSRHSSGSRIGVQQLTCSLLLFDPCENADSRRRPIGGISLTLQPQITSDKFDRLRYAGASENTLKLMEDFFGRDENKRQQRCLIEGMTVEQRYRGKGLEQALVLSAVCVAADAGATEVWAMPESPELLELSLGLGSAITQGEQIAACDQKTNATSVFSLAGMKQNAMSKNMKQIGFPDNIAVIEAAIST